MTTKTVKLIAFIILLVHGIGHLQGLVASFGVKINSSNVRVSWLLKNLGESVNAKICFSLFLVAAVCGILTALSFKGILISVSAWQILATITAVVSTLCLVLFPNGFAMFFNKIGAIGVNLVIYYSIVLNQNWPAVIFDN